MSPHLLTRHPVKPIPEISVETGIEFCLGRVHEICGPARRILALRIAAKMDGPVLWIRPAWERVQLQADGIARFINPGRIVFVDARRAEDVLWSMEEAARSGAVPLVIGEIATPPGLTPIRRLHLAAETTPTPPMVLMLTPEEGGAQGVETRWHIAPSHRDGSSLWNLTRLRARLAPPKSFCLTG